MFSFHASLPLLRLLFLTFPLPSVLREGMQSDFNCIGIADKLLFSFFQRSSWPCGIYARRYWHLLVSTYVLTIPIALCVLIHEPYIPVEDPVDFQLL